MKIAVLPEYKDSNGWFETLGRGAARPSLIGRRSARTVVVGGGISGLSAARRLAENDPGGDIVLLEGNRIGQGASGKNSGFMLEEQPFLGGQGTAEYRAMLPVWRHGLEWMRQRVAEDRIPCQWSDWGRLYGAAGKDGEQNLARLVAALDARGVPYELRDAAEMQRDLATRFYSRGLHVSGNALCNPSALVLGLAEGLPENVSVLENSPVVEMRFDGSSHLLMTPKGEVVADRVVLAAGAMIKHLGIGRGRYVSVATYSSMTERLSDEQIARFGLTDEFGVFGASPNGATIRLTQDRRIVFRNHFTHNPSSKLGAKGLRDAHRLHKEAIARRWPFLSKLKLPHTWGGIGAMVTINGGRIFGEYSQGLFAVVPTDRAPMTKGAALGTILADLMDHRDNPLTSAVMSLPLATRVPPRPFLDLGVHYNFLRQRLKGRMEF